MPIAASRIKADTRKNGGPGTIVAEHEFDDGQIWPAVFQVADGEDASARLAAMIPQRETSRAEHEIRRNVSSISALGRAATVSLRYSTAAANFAELREAFRQASEKEAIMIGDFLGSLTNAQLMAAFGMTNAQVNNLRSSKLDQAATIAASIRSSSGA